MALDRRSPRRNSRDACRTVRRAGLACARVVHEAPEESERVAFVKPRRPDAVGELHLEGGGLVVELRHRAIEVGFERDGAACLRRQPVAQRPLRVSGTGPGAACWCAAAQALVDQHEIQLEVVQLVPPARSGYSARRWMASSTTGCGTARPRSGRCDACTGTDRRGSDSSSRRSAASNRWTTSRRWLWSRHS